MTQPPPPAPGWYPDPSGAGSRAWDGRNWGAAAPPPDAGGLPKKKQSVPKWVIVFAVIAVLIVIGEAGSHSNNSSSTSTSSSTATSAAIDEDVDVELLLLLCEAASPMTISTAMTAKTMTHLGTDCFFFGNSPAAGGGAAGSQFLPSQ